MWSKDAPADHAAMAWLAKVCNGMKQQTNVHSSFTQIVGEVTTSTNNHKFIKK
jgi:hypothetical protein